MSGRFVAVATNVLVYAHNSDSPWHGPARRALESLANAAQPWAIPWPCVHEFLAITTNARVILRAQAMELAIAAVEAWMESPSLRLLGELRGHWPELKAMLLAGRLRGGAVHDVRIAALCREHGVTELWTADRDFSRIPGLRVRNPLLTA